MPPNSTFVRIAPPDAGVECYWTLQDGSEWGWQAKYFPKPLSAAQWAQIDESVKTALGARPNLTKYFVCLPIDRSDGKRKGQTSSLCKWKQHVAKWKKDRNIEFEYWGSSEIEDRLSREEHRGRSKYFFDKEFLSFDWFGRHISDSIADAGSRYHPELNIELPIAKVFDALGRTQEFHSALKGIPEKIMKNLNYATSHNAIQEATPEFNELNSTISLITSILRCADEFEHKAIGFEEIREYSEKAARAAHGAIAKLEERHRENRDSFDIEIYHLRQLMRQLLRLQKCMKHDSCLVANTGALLLSGDAGTGKTHLLCDVTSRRYRSGRLSILLHGGHFTNGNPKDAITKELGLSCTFDELLAALAAGQASGSKLLIMIDALNEGDGHCIWPKYLGGVLNAVSRYQWVGIAMGVRTIYETAIVPELGSEELSRIAHSGFEDNIDDAIKTFFDGNGIERPGVPLLVPEFLNPQFLIILCDGLQNMQMARMPNELQGLTSVYGFFIDSVDKKLSQSSMLDYSEDAKITRRAVDALAELMASKDSKLLEYQEADACLGKIYPAAAHSRSLIRNLISEGILNKERLLDISGSPKHVVQFAYERLADNMIIKSQLKDIESEEDLLALFCQNGDFAKYFSADGQYRGMIDALSIQIPEKFGKEMIEVKPELAGSDAILGSFLGSLMWRRTDSIESSSLSQIREHILEKKHCLDALFKVLLTVSTDPNNPLNGDYLHEYLFKLAMNDRDSGWSIFLHTNYCADSSIVKRYIDWAWNADKSSLKQESIYLASLTLAWFFTSSNRSIRDRATKALISLLANHIDVLVRVLLKFKGCNDPYVEERLYCAAYGCAMRSNDKKYLEKLAICVYSEIFKRSPPLNIQLRDYAKSTIDCALHNGIEISIDYKRVAPPYDSTWISSFPTEADIKELETEHSGILQRNDGACGIFGSLSWMGDFYRYVMEGNTNSFEWSDVRLYQNGESREKQLKEFVSAIQNEQKALLEDYYAITKDKKAIMEEVHKETPEFTVEDYEQEVESVKNDLRKTLNARQQKIFNECIVPYVECSFNQKHPRRFDLQSFARWVTKRVFELGWTKDRFGQYDRQTMRHSFDRTADNERIGKKYQWIAYSELLARVSDNFEFNNEFGELAFRAYRAPWQLMHRRSIDPSLLLSKTLNNHMDTRHNHWWIFFRYDNWYSTSDDAEWLKDTSDMPPFEPIIEVTKPEDGSKWLVLGTNFSFKQQISREAESSGTLSRYIDLYLRSCLARKSDTPRLDSWSKKQVCCSNEFPKPSSIHNAFLGELYWSESAQRPTWYDESSLTSGEPPAAPWAEAYVPICEYTLDRTDDHSVDDVRILLPSKLLVEKMGLTNKNDGTFVDSNNKLIVHDPTVYENGPGSLLIRKQSFMRFLQENGYEVIWHARGQKMALGDWTKGEGSMGVEIQGIYKIVNGKIRGRRSTC